MTHAMKQVTLPRGTIRYRDQGSGPPVVFVHGLLVDGRLWRKVAAPLSATHRCIVPDWPLGSHELAMNPDADLSPPGIARIVADFLAALDLTDVTLVGNDSGGAICQLVVTRHPERVGRLVLTNCDGFEIFPPPEFTYLRTVSRVPGLWWLMSRALLYVPRLRSMRIAYGALSKRGLPDDLVASWMTPCARSPRIRRDLKKFASTVSPRFTLEAAEQLAGFGKPALLLWAPEDPFFTLELAERLAAALGDARIETVADSWVYVPEDQPDRVARAIADFTAGEVRVAAAGG